ncbi:formate dehydrogenase subunit delta [bacterium AH-315-P15]|nr:formate dehydrogenase subunit delta [bacterium AH-315-P15]
MEDQDLIHKANQIAAFFAPYTEEEAVVGIANHLEKFWERRMRKQLQSLAAAGKSSLDPLVLRALAEPNLAG